MKAPQTEQARRDAVLEALGAYQKRGQLEPRVSNLVSLLEGESDRGVVVIIGSLMEDFLLLRLLHKFIPLTTDQRKNLIRSGGVISTFAAKTNLAFALGLIDQEIVDMLGVIKTMRNACAHSRQALSFTTPELRATLSLLYHDEDARIVLGSDDPIALRFLFIVASAFLFSAIQGTSKAASVAAAQQMVDIAMAEAEKAHERLAASRRKQSAQPKRRSRQNPKG